jgi:hypothetical protein
MEKTFSPPILYTRLWQAVILNVVKNPFLLAGK